eukprot:scpid37750/ scgid11585/ Coiled-coil domain-containing protein 22 homolog
MDEVDNIIIVTLRQVGCTIDDSLKTLATFSSELIVEGCVRCLKVINSDVDLPLKLPESMSVRFRIGTALAQACKDVGYEGEIGYQTFLYSNVESVRRLFMFLIERLPRDGGETSDEPTGFAVLLGRNISAELARQLQQRWTPGFCKQHGRSMDAATGHWHWEGSSGRHNVRVTPLLAPTGLCDLETTVGKDARAYFKQHLRPVTQQPHKNYDAVPSILEWDAVKLTAAQDWEIEWNELGLRSGLSQQDYKQRKADLRHKNLATSMRTAMQQSATATRFSDLRELLDSFAPRGGYQQDKGTRFTHAKDLQFTQATETAAVEEIKVESAEDIMQQREDELANLTSKLEKINGTLERMEQDIKRFSTNTSRVVEMGKSLQRANTEKEDDYKIKKKAMEMLPDAEANVLKLQDIVETSAQRIVTLAGQWEQRRQSLIATYRELKVTNSSKMTDTKRMLQEINELRDKIKDSSKEVRAKEELHKQLVTEHERLTKDISRSSYTRRIMEIVNNISKQKREIGKVLSDTRQLQKEINMLSEKLGRTFTATDELIFKDAKKDETCRSAYKYLATLHDEFDQLIKAVEETGMTLREIRDLEDQIEKETKKGVRENLEKITKDYEEIRAENKAYTATLKGK